MKMNGCLIITILSIVYVYIYVCVVVWGFFCGLVFYIYVTVFITPIIIIVELLNFNVIIINIEF